MDPSGVLQIPGSGLTERTREKTGDHLNTNGGVWTRPHIIPLDIARIIFEKAMEDAPIPVHVALVSRQVQYWVEPFIYRHLVFRNPTSLRLFYRTFRERRYSPTKTTSFFAEHVKTLHLSGAAPRMEQIVAIGRGLTSLRTIAGWDNSWGRIFLGFLVHDCSAVLGGRAVNTGNGFHFTLRDEKESWRNDLEKLRRAGLEDNILRGWVEPETGDEGEREESQKQVPSPDLEDQFPYKDLCRFSISAYALRVFRLNLTHRLFQDLTHLDIYYCRLFDWSTLPSMKRLTHISIDLLTHVEMSFTEMRHFMEEVCAQCQTMSHLRAIIFACINWQNRDFDIIDDEGEMVGPLNFSTEDWDKSGPLISMTNDEYHLHYFTQLCLGIRDPRVVLGVVNDCLPRSHLTKEYLIDYAWPKNSYDWDFAVPSQVHRESWEVAEDIIEKRKKDRMEKRQKAGRGISVGKYYESQRVEGEFGFGEAVQRRWGEFHSS